MSVKVPGVRRREFLHAGVAAAVLPAWGWAEEPVMKSPLSSRPRYHKVIFDSRVAAARAFGRDAQRAGLTVHAIEGDVTALWFHDLDRQWKHGPVAIAGLTRAGSLFCLETLARDRGMRLRRCVEHRIGLNHGLEPELPDLTKWALARGSVETPLPELVEDPRRLVSWIIAPKTV